MKKFASLNAFSMKIDDLGEEIKIPASRLIDYMEQSQIVYRQLPAITSALNAIERTLFRFDERFNKIDARLSNIEQHVQQHPVVATARAPIVARTILDVLMRTPQSSNELPIRFSEGSSLKDLTLSSVIFSWFNDQLHTCTPARAEDLARLTEFAQLIYYAKRFLNSNTTIEKIPSNVGRRTAWNATITALSIQMENSILEFLQINKHLWEKVKPGETINPAKRHRMSTPKFYACVKKLKKIDIGVYPKPENVTDLATTEGPYFIKNLNARRGFLKEHYSFH